MIEDIEDIKKVKFDIDDVIVVTMNEFINKERGEAIKSYVGESFPNNKILVLGNNIKINVLSKESLNYE